MIKEQFKDIIEKSDNKLNKILGWQDDPIRHFVDVLDIKKEVEVGFRSCSGSTDKTQIIYREWVSFIKKLKKNGIKISEESIKHKNAYATNNGGFWNSSIYRIQN